MRYDPLFAFPRNETMSRTIRIEDVGSRLRGLIEGLEPSDEITILVDGQPLAKLCREARKTWPCQPGSAGETTHWMAPDFDAPLDDFKEYVE
jgi:hypothetical protein